MLRRLVRDVIGIAHDHEPILDPALFAAVQAKLASQAVERRCRVRGVPALLTGRLFDEQGRRMTPTHTNKKGVRYSYYVAGSRDGDQSFQLMVITNSRGW